MPSLATKLRGACAPLVDLAMMCERLRLNNEVKGELSATRAALVYELAYLKVFNLWELFLEDVMIRYLCGFQFKGTAETPTTGFARTLADGRSRIYGGRPYVLWHNPSKVITMANSHFAGGNRPATVIGSALADVEDYAKIRHRVAHDHADARNKFDNACMRLAARRFPASRAGYFLRYPTHSGGAPMSWLNRITEELCNVAAQLAP